MVVPAPTRPSSSDQCSQWIVPAARSRSLQALRSWGCSTTHAGPRIRIASDREPLFISTNSGFEWMARKARIASAKAS